MRTIIFICHGNICRSPMAEYIAKYLDTSGKNLYYSRAVSLEEIGNDIYPPAKNVLRNNDIPFMMHSAKRISEVEFDEADIIFAMDQSNIRYLVRLFPHKNMSKVKLLDPNGIEDPWYTDNFDKVFEQIKTSIIHFLSEEKL